MAELAWRRSPALHPRPSLVARYEDETWRVDPPVPWVSSRWTLSVRVPGRAACVMQSTDPEALKAIAREWAGRARLILVSNSPFPIGRAEVEA